MILQWSFASMYIKISLDIANQTYFVHSIIMVRGTNKCSDSGGDYYYLINSGPRLIYNALIICRYIV